MQEYKCKLKRRRLVAMGMLFISLLLFTIEIFVFIGEINKDTGKNDDGFLLGFQVGLIIVMLVKSMYDVVVLTRTLKDEHKIRLRYNKENDERMKLIYAKCGIPLIKILSTIFIIVGIIASYFNFIIFYTLICVVMFMLYTSLGLKLYYTKRL